MDLRKLGADLRRRMLELAAHYYVDPESGLTEELRCGDRVYFIQSDNNTIGCFLIVHFDHHATKLHGVRYQFTYLGLGCATSRSIIPVFQHVKNEFAERLEDETVGVLHLTTRTPYAYRSIVRAFGIAVFPIDAIDQPFDAVEIARHLQQTIHQRPVLNEAQNPFVLRQVKKGPFNSEEIDRIKRFPEETPLRRLGVDCDGSDEIIVFHTFTKNG